MLSPSPSKITDLAITGASLRPCGPRSTSMRTESPGAGVSLSLSADQDNASVTVEDRGPGVPPERLKEALKVAVRVSRGLATRVRRAARAS